MSEVVLGVDWAEPGTDRTVYGWHRCHQGLERHLQDEVKNIYRITSLPSHFLTPHTEPTDGPR